MGGNGASAEVAATLLEAVAGVVEASFTTTPLWSRATPCAARGFARCAAHAPRASGFTPVVSEAWLGTRRGAGVASGGFVGAGAAPAPPPAAAPSPPVPDAAAEADVALDGCRGRSFSASSSCDESPSEKQTSPPPPLPPPPPLLPPPPRAMAAASASSAAPPPAAEAAAGAGAAAAGAAGAAAGAALDWIFARMFLMSTFSAGKGMESFVGRLAPAANAEAAALSVAFGAGVLALGSRGTNATCECARK